MKVIKKTKLLIVGSGANGIAFAAYLLKAGIDDFTIITKHDDFGGAWYQNRYPGCQTDVAINVYQLSFAMKSDWRGNFGDQDELEEYLQGIARDYGLYEKTDFDTEMLDADWLPEMNCWRVVTQHGIYLTDFLIPVTGYLEEVVMPKLPGMDQFQGKSFHASMWPEGYTGEGDRIAVIGTGASAMQIVPATQPVADKVVVFQRTPNFLFPKNYVRFTEEERRDNATNGRYTRETFMETLKEIDQLWITFATNPYPEKMKQLRIDALEYLAQEVKDPVLRAKLTPDFGYGCKRISKSDDYYFALTQPNVDLIAESAGEIYETGVISASGQKVDVDTIVYATGYIFGGTILQRIKRRDNVRVADYQGDHPRAYMSTSVAGCPNLFLVAGAGPNGQTPSGFIPGEVLPAYVMQIMSYMEENGILALEVKEEAEIEWKRHADETLARGPTVTGGCTNYSQDPAGRNKAAWPGTMEPLLNIKINFDHYQDVTLRGEQGGTEADAEVASNLVES